ncbi:hypothetical protein IWZ00DRAFT_573734 [Phyllosticta capitalensis]
MARKKQTSWLSTGERLSVANAERQRSLMSIPAPAQCGSDGNPEVCSQRSADNKKANCRGRHSKLCSSILADQQTLIAITHEPSTVIKQLEERRDFARTVANVKNYLAEKEEQDELIANHGQQIARLRAELSEQRTEIDSLKEEMRVNNNLPNGQNNNRALEGMIREFKETELPVLKSLAKLLFSMEKIYRASAETGQEKDDFLTNIEKELGSGRYAYFLRIGKKICEQGLDFPELELYHAGEEDE